MRVNPFVLAETICWFYVFAAIGMLQQSKQQQQPQHGSTVLSFVGSVCAIHLFVQIKSIYLYMRLALSLFAFSLCILIFNIFFSMPHSQ